MNCYNLMNKNEDSIKIQKCNDKTKSIISYNL